MLLRKYHTEAFKAVDVEKRETVGILSASSRDREGDYMDQGALRDALAKFHKRSGTVCWQHNWSAGGIGRLLDFDGDAEKTVVHIRYGKGYSIVPPFSSAYKVDDIWAQIEQGIIRTHSWAGDAETRERETKFKGQPERDVVPGDVFELTVCTVPAHGDASFDPVKWLGKAAQFYQPTSANNSNGYWSIYPPGTWNPAVPDNWTGTGNVPPVSNEVYLQEVQRAIREMDRGTRVESAEDERRALDLLKEAHQALR